MSFTDKSLVSRVKDKYINFDSVELMINVLILNFKWDWLHDFNFDLQLQWLFDKYLHRKFMSVYTCYCLGMDLGSYTFYLISDQLF